MSYVQTDIGVQCTVCGRKFNGMPTVNAQRQHERGRQHVAATQAKAPPPKTPPKVTTVRQAQRDLFKAKPPAKAKKDPNARLMFAALLLNENGDDLEVDVCLEFNVRTGVIRVREVELAEETT